MADATTTNYGWTKPTVGADSNAWGGILNADLDGIDTALKAVSDRAFVTGMIVLWSGLAASIPAGWVLCDGSGGTPNLRDRFVIGSGGAYPPNTTGGSATITVTVDPHALTLAEIPSHSHGVSDPGHSHSHTIGNRYGSASSTNFDPDLNMTGGPFGGPIGPSAISIGSSGTGISVSTNGGGGGHGHTASASSNLPPYYALCYIMKS